MYRVDPPNGIWNAVILEAGLLIDVLILPPVPRPSLCIPSIVHRNVPIKQCAGMFIRFIQLKVGCELGALAFLHPLNSLAVFTRLKEDTLLVFKVHLKTVNSRLAVSHRILSGPPSCLPRADIATQLEVLNFIYHLFISRGTLPLQ